jgi:hypothetical protein
MTESYADEEIRIGKACDALDRFEKPNIARAARDFDVNERKLRNRFNGIPSKSEYGGQNKTLTDNQELAVYHYLDRMDQTGIPARPRMLRSVANSILARNHDEPDTPPPLIGPDWSRRFLKRHPEYIKRKSKPLAYNRKNTHDPVDIRAHFDPDEDIGQKLDLLQTPHKHLDVRQFAVQLSDELDEAEISPGLRMKVRKFMKGSLARVEAGAQAEDDYSHTKVAENARAARKKAYSKVVQKGGVIYAEQARKRIKFREDGDAEADAKRIALLKKRQKQSFLDWFELSAVTARNRIRRLKT